MPINFNKLYTISKSKEKMKSKRQAIVIGKDDCKEVEFDGYTSSFLNSPPQSSLGLNARRGWKMAYTGRIKTDAFVSTDDDLKKKHNK